MADTRAVLVGTGVLLLILGFFVSNLVCGIGLIFIILGLVIWQREEDDTADYVAMASPERVAARARRRRRRALLVAVVAVVLVTGLVGYLMFLQPPIPDTFTGIRVAAPVQGCWRGTVGTNASTTAIHVDGCGPEDVPLTCTVSLWANLTKTTTENWTLSVSGYRDGRFLGMDSVSSYLGTVRHTFMC